MVPTSANEIGKQIIIISKFDKVKVGYTDLLLFDFVRKYLRIVYFSVMKPLMSFIVEL